MKTYVCVYGILILSTLRTTEEVEVRIKREHVPPEGTPTFLRDAVERSFSIDAETRSAYIDTSEFGSQYLPLRASVESIPDAEEFTKRLPLRDAVERRIYDYGETEQKQPSTDESDPFSLEKKYTMLQNHLSPALVMPQQIFPQPVISQYTFYTPYTFFANIVGDVGQFPEYRVDNSQQQLIKPLYTKPGDSDQLKEGQERVTDKRIVCYIEGGAVYRKAPLNFGPQDLEPYACTHVIYLSATIDPKTYKVKPRDEEYDIIQGGYRSVTALKQRNPDLKVLLAIGDKDRDSGIVFRKLVLSPSHRRSFIRSIAEILSQYRFDGIDLHWRFLEAQDVDWQYADKEHFGSLLEEMYDFLNPQGWLIAVTAPPSRFKVEEVLNIDILGKIVDFVHVEAYDFHRYKEPTADHHAPFNSRPHDNGNDEFYNFDYAAHYWMKQGFPRSKLVMGIPFFGRSFTLVNPAENAEGARIKSVGEKGDYTQTPGFLAYFEICALIQNNQLQKRTDVIGSPYIVYGDQWIGYDDPESIEKKVLYVREMNLGGVALWTADLDDYKGLCGEPWPLLNVVNNVLREQEFPTIYDEIIDKPFRKCNNEGTYSDPKNCASYYECQNGLTIHKTCATNNLFNAHSGKCDSLDASNCKPGQQVFFPKLKRFQTDNDYRASLVEPKVVCYVTSWAFYRKGNGKFVPENLDSELCTHVVYAFATLDPEKLLLKEFDPWADIDNSLYERVTALQNVKVLLGLGGWTDSAGDKYSKLVSDGSNRRKFVVGAVRFLRKHGFQGLHFDWNYPVCWQSNCKKGPATDKPNFTKLIQELKQEFDKQDPPLTIAATISGYKEVIDVAYDLSALGEALEFMSVMTYDYHGSWERKTGHVSPLYGKSTDTYPQYNTNFTLQYLVSKGAPRKKLLMGIPFYGQTFTLAKRDGKYEEGVPVSAPGEAGEYTKQPGMLSYYEICTRIKNQRWTYKRQGSGPYAYLNDQWVSFDDPDSAREKAEYVSDNGFGGIVAWTVDLDDFENKCCKGSFPLLRSINRGLGLLSDSEIPNDCTKPPPPSTPEPPKSTTGFDTSAESSTWDSQDHDHDHDHTTKKPTTTKRPLTTTTKKPTTSEWWELSTEEASSTVWWKPSTTKQTTTTTKPWWATSTTSESSSTPWWATSSTKSTTTRPTQATRSTPAAPEFDEEKPKKCYPGQYLPDPYNCNAYYRCILGELRKQYCAGGLHWNNNRKVCDWPSVAKCKEKSQQATQRPRPTRTTHWEDTSPSTTTRRPTTNWWHTSSKASPLPPKKCETGQYYPHESCDSFYVCVNGILITQKCGPGLYWNQEESRCDWRFRVKCSESPSHTQQFDRFTKNPTLLAHKPQTSCSAGSYSAVKGSCDRYLHCLWGKYEMFSCANGLHWNREKNICDWPKNAKCVETEGMDVDVDEVDEEPPVTTKPTAKPSTTKKPWEWKPTTSKPADGQSTTKNPWEWTTTRKPYTTTTPEPPAVPFEPLSGYFKIVCYFTNWAWYRRGIGKYVPEDINPNLCTHIVYGFAVLDYERLVIKAHDSWADFDNHFYERVVAYKKAGKKVSLAIGGWNDSLGDKYSRLVNNPSARARFIKHVIEFLEKYGFDGLDLDWEYPKCWQVDCKKGPDSDKPAFSAFVKELKQAFKQKGLLLSAAVSPSKTVVDAGYDVPVLAQNLDWIAVMTYDYHGQWDKQTGHVAPLYVHPEDENVFFNANFSIHYWIAKGTPRRKIVMGMPLYGQSFQLEKVDNHGLNAKAPGPGQAGEYTRAAGFLAYYEICDKVKNQGWTVVQDPKRRMGPYAYKGNQWVSYDDQEQIRLKSEFIRKMDLGGGMIWALDLDDFRNRCGEGRHPLLSTIRRILATPGSGIPESPEVPEENLEVEEVPERKPESPKPPEIEHPGQVASSPAAPTIPQSTTTTSRPLTDPNSEYKVVCYFTNWAWYRQGVGKYLPSDIDPDLCTHIVYGFAVLNGDQLVIKPHDTWADYDNNFYEKVTAYKKKGIKVLIAIGGWNDSAGGKYSRLVNNPHARKRFIDHVVQFIEKNNFDGLDLDWEYPKCWQVDCKKGPASDKPAFAEFVKELREAFRPNWLLSAAVSPSKRVIDAGYDVLTLSRYLDWIAVMCYDYHGQWDKITGHVAPMYAHEEDADLTFNTNFTIHYWISKGADRKKLVMGMPLYGQSFSLADNSQNGLNAPTYGGGEAGEETRARGFLAYYEICSNINKKGWKVVRDPKGRIGPYAYLRDQWVSFDDIDMIHYKSTYIKKMGLGGGMIWALDLDDFKNVCGCEEYPLLRTINRVLRDYPKPAPKCALGLSGPSKPPRSTQKPITSRRPSTDSPYKQTDNKQCNGTQIFVPHPHNCNQYYLCNQGRLELQSCPVGLYWNKRNCDWPQNTQCTAEGASQETELTNQEEIEIDQEEPEEPELEETEGSEVPEQPVRPSESGTDLSDGGYKIVCYFTNWAWYRQGAGKYTPDDIDASLCTHIIYAFAVLDPNSLKIKPHDTWADIDNDFYKKVTALRTKGIKVLLGLGGWNDSEGDKYSRLVNSAQARVKFVKQAVQFIEKWNFEGLDLDWEYPKCWQVDCKKGPDSDKQGFAKLVEELSAEFRPRKWLLSAAVSPSKTVIDAGYDVSTLNQYLDWISIMDYDFHGHWDRQTGHVAPLYYYPGDQYDYFNANFSIHYWIEKGASPNKLIMGMPMYGQSFTLADPKNRGLNAKSIGPGEAGEFTRAAGFMAYYEICERVQTKGWTVTRDSEGRIGPFASKGYQWVSYDDVAQIRRKSEYLKNLGLGGGMIWALDLDDFRNRCGCGKHPLLKTINAVLRGFPSNVNKCT